METQPTEKNPQFKLSIDTQTIMSILREAQIGDVVPYHTLTEAIRKDVTKEGRSPMDSARRVLMRDKNIVFDCIRGVGLKRLSDCEITETSATFIRQARRKADKGLKTIACADYQKLNQEQRNQHNVGAAILGVMKLAGASNSINKIKSLSLSKSEPPKIEDVLGAFGKRG